jgi:hypothetical protein
MMGSLFMDPQAEDPCVITVTTEGGTRKKIRLKRRHTGCVGQKPEPFKMFMFRFLAEDGQPLETDFTGEVVDQTIHFVPGNIRDIDALRAQLQPEGG